MTATSLDFSQRPDLLPLARVAGALQAIAAPAEIEYFLMGAAARDLLLCIPTERDRGFRRMMTACCVTPTISSRSA